MKWIFSLFFIILFSCISTLNSEGKPINEKLNQKLVAHITKIRNLLRILEEDTIDDEQSESESSVKSKDDAGSEPSEESGSESFPESSSQLSPEINQTSSSSQNIEELKTQSPESGSTPPSSKRESAINVRGYNSFRLRTVNPQESLIVSVVTITFNLFIYYYGYNPFMNITMTLRITTVRYLRNLQDKESSFNTTAICILDQEDEGKTGELIKYNCEAPEIDIKEQQLEKVEVLPDFKFEEEKIFMYEISISEQAVEQAASLQEQTQTITRFFTLDNGQLINNYLDKFIIIGDIKEYNGKIGNNNYYINFINSDHSKINITCSIKNIEEEKYTFECIPLKTINGSLYYSQIFDLYNNFSIFLNITGNDIINFVVKDPIYSSRNSTTTKIYSKPNYRKKSSGLSGGVIAGIVIVCALVLILGTVIIMMLRKVKSPLDNSISIVGLKEIDSYSE